MQVPHIDVQGASGAIFPAVQERTLVDVLAERAASQPDQLAYSFMGEGDQGEEGWLRLTYRDLFEQAAGLASLLQADGLTGERVLLVFKSNALFVISFFACLMAGAVAVPTAPPRRDQLSQRLRAIAANAEAKAGVSDAEDVLQSTAEVGDVDLYWLDVRQLSRDDTLCLRASQWRPMPLRGNSLAFLQYTSGSTGDPKGVMVSHGNIMANSAHIAEAFGHAHDSRGLVSLPLYHDMGLIGGILQPIYVGFPVYVMTPAQFVQKPQRWLQLISQLSITAAGGPNFMYDRAAQVIQDEHLDGIDLSSWRVAFCGAEPIRVSTIEGFTRRFAAHGFQAGSFYPCYGMAETTLFVTGTTLGEGPRVDSEAAGSTPVVGCGHPRQDTRIEIVDPATGRALPDAQEGEIWVQGAIVAQGYWRNPTATAHTFHARLAGSGDGPFLRTGDLGYRKGANLFVTGRLKDLIILRGRNYAPQDLEVEAEGSHPGLQPGGGVAFTLTQGDQERLILAFELKREWRRREGDWPGVEAAVRAAIARNCQLRVHDVVLLAPGALPRTSSGKVRRSQCRADYLGGRLAAMTPVSPRASKSLVCANACLG